MGLIAAAKLGLKEHGGLALARRLMVERKLTGPRPSSRLPEQIEPVMAKPMVSAGMSARRWTSRRRRRGGMELGPGR